MKDFVVLMGKTPTAGIFQLQCEGKDALDMLTVWKEGFVRVKWLNNSPG